MKAVTPRKSRRVTFALLDDIEGRRRTYLLRAGVNRIGSLPGSDVRLTTRGVSKRHALLIAEEDALCLDDLASKNGTFRNGRRVESTVIEAGDEIRFGPASLRVERLPTSDERMAIEIQKCPAPALSAPGRGRQTPFETSHLSPRVAEHGTVDWMRVIETFAQLLPIGGSGLASALGFLGDALEAPGLGLFERTASGLSVLALGGPQGSPPAEALNALPAGDSAGRFGAKRARFASGQSGPANSGEEALTTAGGEGPPPWVLAARAGGPALVAWGSLPLRQSCEPLLRLALVLCESRLKPARAARHRPGNLHFPSGHVRGVSAGMRALYESLGALAGSDLPVLVLGETGAGKEGIARLVHDSSSRHNGPFIAVNCAAIPDDLLEAELFGIGRGVATGVEGRQGKIEQADGGTFFLDEIGDMPAHLQSKLLRALQEREIHPVGGGPRPVDVRVVAATNVDLLSRVERGAFRRDLYYRLAGFVARIPALRERRDDIPALIEHFLRAAAAESGKAIRGLTEGALRRLVDRPWPGNVRELEHEVRRLVYLCPDSQPITSSLLPEEPTSTEGELDVGSATSLDLAAIERRVVTEALARTGGNRTGAARLLGISREALRRRIRRHRL